VDRAVQARRHEVAHCGPARGALGGDRGDQFIDRWLSARRIGVTRFTSSALNKVAGGQAFVPVNNSRLPSNRPDPGGEAGMGKRPRPG